MTNRLDQLDTLDILDQLGGDQPADGWSNLSKVSRVFHTLITKRHHENCIEHWLTGTPVSPETVKLVKSQEEMTSRLVDQVDIVDQLISGLKVEDHASELRTTSYSRKKAPSEKGQLSQLCQPTGRRFL